MTTLSKLLMGATLACALQAAPAQAQTRTWVSGNGSDANPCSFTSPCKTLAGAISKTLAGGEISIMDADAVGPVTITKSITINGEGTLGSILTTNGPGIVVKAGADDKVILRNLSINGTSGGSTGIQVLSGQVTVDKCFVYGFNVGFIGGIGIMLSASDGAKLDVRDTNITDSTYGVWVQATSGFGVATLDNVRINGSSGYGVITASNNAVVAINRSFISNSGLGAVIATGGNGSINVSDTHMTSNNTAVNAATAGALIRLSNNSIFNNATAYAIAVGATIATANNNKTGSNGGVTLPNGMVTIQ